MNSNWKNSGANVMLFYGFSLEQRLCDWWPVEFFNYFKKKNKMFLKKAYIYYESFNIKIMDTTSKPNFFWVLIVFLSLWSSCNKKENQVPPPIPAPFITVVAKDVPLYKEFAAQTFGDLDIVLTARVDGILTGIHFIEGQKVRKGQLLYTIDPLECDTKVEQVKGQVATSQSNLANAEEELKRIGSHKFYGD